MSICCSICGKTLKSEESKCLHEEVAITGKACKVIVTRGKLKGKIKLVLDDGSIEDALEKCCKEYGFCGYDMEYTNSGSGVPNAIV